MILYPAIDLKDGKCVRLLRGEMEEATVFNLDPAKQAREFADQGFQWIHVVDLNGAFAGKPVNHGAVEGILKAVDLPIQLGGGIRSLKTLENWLTMGIARVVLGTVAISDPDLVRTACREFQGKIAVGIDARDGYVAVEGWARTTTVKAVDLALTFEDAGVAAIVYTDINRDGAMGGVNVEATAELASKLTTPVIASGGVSSIEDVKAIAAEKAAGVAGVISGRALYDGRIDPADALAVLKAAG